MIYTHGRPTFIRVFVLSPSKANVQTKDQAVNSEIKLKQDSPRLLCFRLDLRDGLENKFQGILDLDFQLLYPVLE